MKIKGISSEIKDFLYNLALVAPGKGEAKKTVSNGKIFLELDGDILNGMATDDILSVHGEVSVSASNLEDDKYGTVTLDRIKNLLVGLRSVPEGVIEVEIDVDQDDDDDYYQLFWWGHVADSISGKADSIPTFSTLLSPERLRKFSLLEPRGAHPIKFDFVEWSDRDIIRWSYGPNYRGVLAILEGH